MTNSKINKKTYYSKRYFKKAQAILEELGMEDDQMEIFLMLPMSNKELYELALELKEEVEKTEEHLKDCNGCEYCDVDFKKPSS